MTLTAFQYDFTGMGSPCSLHIYASSLDESETVTEAAENEVLRLEGKYSRYRSDGILASMNATGKVGGSIEVDEETAGLLDYAFACYRNSDGLFDVTSGVLRKGWNFSSTATLPKKETIAELLSLVGMEKLLWEFPVLTFSHPDMELDFGGIVKEYAADKVAEICHKLGICHGLIELGGDIRIIGSHPDNSPWRIDIRDPLKPERVLTQVHLTEGALAGSGDYERCFEIDGIRYGHLLNPQSGYPVRGLSAVHVVADRCLVAGSVSTIAMLKGTEGSEWLESLPLSSLWVDDKGCRGGIL